MASRTRSRDRHGESRRRFLLRAGTGGALLLGAVTAARDTGAFTSVTGDRGSSVDVAADDQALVGVVTLGPVQKNQRESMVDVTNNWADVASFTVSLSTCSDGTLYDNEGDSGCSVTVSLASGDSRTFDIDAAVTGTIPFTITGSAADLSFSTSASVQAESGNVAGAIDIRQPDSDGDFTAVTPQGNQGNQFEVKQVDIRDADGDDDLVEVKYEVFEGTLSGTQVAEKVVSLAPTGKYSPKGNPAEVIQPDAGYTIQSGQQYTLRVTGTDNDGNFDTVNFQDTA